MSEVMYKEIDLLIDEARKEILINPRGERFYFVECHEQHKIFRNAILHYDAEKNRYEIEGEQTLYTEHKESGWNYEKLLCCHPAELIVKKSFLGFTWYTVCGIMKRDIRSHYLCKHEQYRIHERLEVIEQTIIKEC